MSDPVFFASRCGQTALDLPSATTFSVEDAHDYRLSSLGAAVEWSKLNNLLGVLLDAELLVSVFVFVPLPYSKVHSLLAPDTISGSRRERFWIVGRSVRGC